MKLEEYDESFFFVTKEEKEMLRIERNLNEALRVLPPFFQERIASSEKELYPNIERRVAAYVMATKIAITCKTVKKAKEEFKKSSEGEVVVNNYLACKYALEYLEHKQKQKT